MTCRIAISNLGCNSNDVMSIEFVKDNGGIDKIYPGETATYYFHANDDGTYPECRVNYETDKSKDSRRYINVNGNVTWPESATADWSKGHPVKTDN